MQTGVFSHALGVPCAASYMSTPSLRAVKHATCAPPTLSTASTKPPLSFDNTLPCLRRQHLMTPPLGPWVKLRNPAHSALPPTWSTQKGMKLRILAQSIPVESGEHVQEFKVKWSKTKKIHTELVKE